ncbi:hypothetical protein DFO63_3908 [Stenotrophomonas sp. AG209]|nr:hypothetical protein DFO63_3908 [Stenotrophomonas sp. AG209]
MQLYRATSSSFLEKLIIGYGSHYAVRESLSRLSQKAEKTRKS